MVISGSAPGKTEFCEDWLHAAAAVVSAAVRVFVSTHVIDVLLSPSPAQSKQQHSP